MNFWELLSKLGYVRYGTIGAANRNNCQPIEINHQLTAIPTDTRKNRFKQKLPEKKRNSWL